MNAIFRRQILVLALLAPSLGALPVRAEGAAKALKNPEAQMKKMMEAIKNRSYEGFLEGTDENMKAELTKQMFEGVSGQLSDPLKKGYRTTHLGQLQQMGHTVHLWKLEISEQADQTLIKMSVKDGLVSGFLLQ